MQAAKYILILNKIYNDWF